MRGADTSVVFTNAGYYRVADRDWFILSIVGADVVSSSVLEGQIDGRILRWIDRGPIDLWSSQWRENNAVESLVHFDHKQLSGLTHSSAIVHCLLQSAGGENNRHVSEKSGTTRRIGVENGNCEGNGESTGGIDVSRA